MARKLKHSKIKNTSILFELLTRQITADVLAGKSTKSVKIVKKYFNEDTELGKELQLYRLLSEKHYESESRANDLINIVLKSRHKLSNSKLRNEKYNLIKEIKENYNSDDFFNGTVLEHITSKKISSKEAKAHVLKEYNKSDKDLRLLAYQILVDKFNQKYKTLDESQKNLLKNYINNVSNTNSLRSFVNTEAKKIDTALKLNLPQVSDKITSIKLNEAIKQIDNLTKGKIVNEKQVLTLMRYYELVKELKNVHKI